MQKGSLSQRVLSNGTKVSQSYMYISNAEGVVVTEGTPQWYQGISILYAH